MGSSPIHTTLTMKPSTLTKLFKRSSEFSDYKVTDVSLIFRKNFNNGKWEDDVCYRVSLNKRPYSNKELFEMEEYIMDLIGYEILFDFDDACSIF